VKICSLASGSKGNCLYLETGDARVLIDAGLSLRETLLRMQECGIEPDGIHAVLVTHEHIDHIRSAGSFSRKFKVPVLASHLLHRKAEKYLAKTQVIEFESGNAFTFRASRIDPFPITHDACDPVGFVIESREGRCGSATDLGIVTRLVTEKLRGCRALNLESNHDPEMLMNGPYPWHLKQRIKSRHGHISNSESMGLLHDLLHEKLEGVFLAHLSETNNDPKLPQSAAEKLLAGQNCCSPVLCIGEQYQPSKMFVI